MISPALPAGSGAAALPLLPIFNALPGAYLLLSTELTIEAATDDYLAATGTRREQLVGRYVFEAFPENPTTPEAHSVQNVRAAMEHVLTTGQPHDMPRQHYDVPDPARPGQFMERHWQPRHVPVFDAQGRVEHIIQAVVDVTQQVQVEAQLRQDRAHAEALLAEAERQRQRLERLFVQAPALINTQLGPNHVFDIVHPLTYQLLGNRPLAGRSSREALPELEGPFHDLLDQVYRTGEPYQGRAVHARFDRHNNGQLDDAYFDFTYQPLLDTQGQVEGVITFAVEVTEQIRAQQRADTLQAELLAAARRQVQERESLYQIFEQTPAAICIQHGPEHRYAYVNPAYQALFPGRPLIGLTLTEALPEMAPQGFKASLDEVYATGNTYYGLELPATIAASGGQPERTGYFNFTQQAIRENGRIVGTSIFAYDVTEQVLLRQQQQAQQQRLQELLEQAPVAIAVFRGPQYVIELANPAVCALWDRTPVQALGTPLFALLPEAAGQGFEQLLDEVMATGVPYVAHELPATLHRHGRHDTVYWNFVYHPLREPDGQVTGVTVVATDVSEQVAARQQLTHTASELQLLLANTPAFIFRTNAAGQLTYANDALFAWSGLERQQLMSLDEVWSIVHPDDLLPLQTQFSQALTQQQPWESPTYRIRRRDGQYRWSITRTQPYFRPDGQFGGISGFNLEIHDQVELQRQLTRVNVDLDNFVYTASHDLKAPITNIEGLLHVLGDHLSAGTVGTETTQVLGMMQDSVDRFKRTIELLSDVLKLQKEQDQPATTVALPPILRDVQLDLQPLIQKTQARLEVDVAPETSIYFTEKNLRSVLYNLISNALKYRHPERPPQVRISCRYETEYCVLAVQDNGLGIAASQQPELFMMFRRLHSHVEGTGIGLYMVKRMVENGGGRIEASSTPGVGSTFSVYFPHLPV